MLECLDEEEKKFYFSNGDYIYLTKGMTEILSLLLSSTRYVKMSRLAIATKLDYYTIRRTIKRINEIFGDYFVIRYNTAMGYSIQYYKRVDEQKQKYKLMLSYYRNEKKRIEKIIKNTKKSLAKI